MHSIFSLLFILKTEWSGESQNCRTGNGVTMERRDFKAVIKHCDETLCCSETGSDRPRKKKSRALSKEVDKRGNSVNSYLVF